VQHGAVTFDVYTTREVVSAGARKDDPLTRPFAKSPEIYPAIQANPTMLNYVARRMQRSPHPLLRHSWWLPQSAIPPVNIIFIRRSTMLLYADAGGVSMDISAAF